MQGDYIFKFKSLGEAVRQEAAVQNRLEWAALALETALAAGDAAAARSAVVEVQSLKIAATEISGQISAYLMDRGDEQLLDSLRILRIAAEEAAV